MTYMEYQIVTWLSDDVTWPPKVLWGSMVGYPSDSLASCYCTMLRRARYWCDHAASRPSVTLRYRDHIGWNTSNIKLFYCVILYRVINNNQRVTGCRQKHAALHGFLATASALVNSSFCQFFTVDLSSRSSLRELKYVVWWRQRHQSCSELSCIKLTKSSVNTTTLQHSKVK